MSFTLFSATGCMRCSIVKSYLDEHDLVFEEYDIKAAGKDRFNKFYKENRSNIFRGEEGVEFPILFTQGKIVQGVGVILAFLRAKETLDGFVTRSDLSHGWVSGLNVSAKSLTNGDAFVEILRFLNRHGLMIQLEADGRNAHLLEIIIKENLISRLIFILRGPIELYKPLTGAPLDKEELQHSLSLLDSSFAYRIILPISPFMRANGEAGYLSPEEALSAAKLVETATGSKKHPFFIKPVILPLDFELDLLPPSALFKYRTACRRHMVLAEIQK